MFWDAKLKGLLIRGPPGVAPMTLAGAGLELEPLFQNAPVPGPGLRANSQWFLAHAVDESANPWEAAHLARSRVGLAFAGGATPTFVEPDLEQTFHATEELPGRTFALTGGVGVFDPQDETLPLGPGFAWHLRPEFSQLLAARAGAGDGQGAWIAHLDTGFDDGHRTKPDRLQTGPSWDFVDNKAGAIDPGTGGFLKNPGHGTGTLSILAGSVASDLQPALGATHLGGAPQAEVIPYRIATSVVLLRTSALARGIDAALRPRLPDGTVQRPVDVISLSMGGLASAAWAASVNAAYEAGICIVAAAGNNFSIGIGSFPTRFIVYPARFRRVIAACGVMANRAPYGGLSIGRMQGNYGPSSKMDTAIAAFTPNISWAERGAPEIVDMNGAGTSSATPQVAAAAALWIAKHRPTLDASYPGWNRVEAVRRALFTSAQLLPSDDPERLGRGVLRANDALSVVPAKDLAQTPPDSAELAFFKVLFGLGARADPERDRMLAIEAAQLVQRPVAMGVSNEFEALVADPDRPDAVIPEKSKERFLEALRSHPHASATLKDHLTRTLGGGGPSPARSAPPRPRKRRAPQSPPKPPRERKLRGYAYDPSLQLTLDTRSISEVTFRVPWETVEAGPRGEYLEVIDYDPASRAFYRPIDLEVPALLAQDGLAPSEGNPQFHQQFVYAVASLTIRRFEQALGRRALWAPGPPAPGANPLNDSTYVQRLRIYPHALRDANAYYSPTKKALLFGYFRASTIDPAEHLPGGLVFACLSHDIVAHETAHALLDGLHRRFSEATNTDQRAFHEAFADIVALFQHFSFPEVLQYEISRSRGDIRTQQNHLGQLALEFGTALGMHGALRDYINKPARSDQYLTATEAHDRGAVLVAAVFDAFLQIYESRTRDLLRIATGGSGILPSGAIHPDLVARLSKEAARAADHVLGICIRALDYCPPVDLTFGDYLRALVTADRDLVRDDPFGYRVAFVDSFRRRGIYPRDDVRTLSEETLVWRGPETDHAQPSGQLQALGASPLLRSHIARSQFAGSRRDLFLLERDLRLSLHAWLKDRLDHATTGTEDAAFLGLERGRAFEVHSARFANRVGPDGDLLSQFIIELLQRPETGVERGCTLIIDARNVEILYVIRKKVTPTSGATAAPEQSLWRTYLGARAAAWASAEPFAVLHRWPTSED